MRAAVFLLSLTTLAVSLVAGETYNDVSMLCLVNKERQRAGLSPLGLDSRLTSAAYAHSKDQARMRKMSHTGSDGSSASKRVSRAGYNWRSVGENVAYGYNSMAEVMRQWMNSSGHRANILGKQFTMFGSGCADAGSTRYFTQTFASDGGKATNVPNCGGSSYPSPAPAPSYGDDEDDSDSDYGNQRPTYNSPSRQPIRYRTRRPARRTRRTRRRYGGNRRRY